MSVWLTGPDPVVRCCEFIGSEKECYCTGERVVWHSAYYCPFCRGEGELVGG